MEEALSYLTDRFSNLHSSLQYITKAVTQIFLHLKFYWCLIWLWLPLSLKLVYF